MLAIMGASGSGKTTLLSLLGKRLYNYKGCKFEGEQKINGLEIGDKDFGKIGAFLMQDDVLIETMTPFECFCFAAKLKTKF
jgi:ABC-type multidrug transport system ATPase subunit